MVKKKRNRKVQPAKNLRSKTSSHRPLGRKPGVLYNALPSHGKMNVQLGATGFPEMIYPSRISLTPDMLDKLVAIGQSYWFPRPEPLSDFNPKWVMNTLADADHYPHALQALDEALKENPVPVFNHPYAVLKSRRDYVWSQLKDIPNLVVPKCVRFLATNPNHFLRAFEKSNFTFPVIIRPTGSHTGQDMVFVESQDEWHKIFTIPWGGLEMYMTQWVDFQSAQGEWRKLRLSITPDRIGLRHILFGENWLIHAMERDNDTVDREMEILQSADDWVALQQIGSDIRDRMGMDYFGVDLGYKSDQEFVLFEANASMSILSRVKMPSYREDEYEANVLRIESDVWRAIERFTQQIEN
jgi:hypothetical protein